MGSEMCIRDRPRAVKTPAVTVMLAAPYNLLERLRRLADLHKTEILDETFAVDVTLTLRLPQEFLPGLQADLLELSKGAIQAEVMEESILLLPLPDE